MLYRSPTVLTRHRLVSLNLGTPTFQRAPGEASGTFALESAMDELAAELRMDPVDLRLKNYAEENEEEQKPWSSKTLRECYRIGAERFGWAKRSAKPRSMTDGRWLVGYGMATATYPTVRRPASSFVRLDLDEGGRPRAVVRAASHELGTGTYTILTQIVAATLGIAPDRIGCELGDTRFPPSPISAGSMTAASAGSAAFDAASEVRSRVIALAIADRSSPLFNQPRERVTLAGGRIALVGDPERGEPLETFLARHGDGVEARADSAPSPDAKHFSMHAFGAVFVEVKVDPELGIVRVPRVVAAYGAGRILNPKTARSQLLGGIVWGLGMGLFEEGLLDPRTGRVLNADLAEYLVPTNADVMDIDVTTVAERDEHVNPLGVKGIGEIGITGVAAALANAIHHATGVRVRELPITLDRLMAEPA